MTPTVSTSKCCAKANAISAGDGICKETKFYHKRWYLLALLIISALASYSQTTLYSENFTYSNGTTQGSGNPAKWTRNTNGFTPTTFSVQTNQFQFTNTTGEVIWLSQVFPITGWLSVSASVDLPASTNMEAADYLRVYYKIDGGAEMLFTTNGNNTGTYAARTASVSGLSGTGMQIVVRASNNAANENHYIDNVSVTGLNDIYYEPFNYADGTIVSPLWTRNLNGCLPGNYSVQSAQMNVTFTTTTSCEIIWYSSILNIAPYASITARLNASEPNGLEPVDYMRTYYKLDGGAETYFSTNGNLTDDFGSAVVSQSALSGTTFQIVIRIQNNSGETHLFDNVTVTADNFSGALTASAAGTNITCNGASAGAVNLTVTGGRAPYSFSWSNGATTEDISNVAAGTYTVTVTDNRGTTATASQTLTQPAAWNFTKTLSNYNGVNVSCNGASDGSIDLTVTGNTSPYTFLWSTGATTEDISGRPAGVYTVTVTDVNGCTGSNSTTLTQPAVLSTSETHVNVSCFGGSNGSIDLSVAGGTTPYSYSWSNGATTQDISGLSAASYTVTVTDVNGCTSTRTVIVTQPAAPLSGSISAADTICNGQKITIDLTVSGGTSPYTYSWNTGAVTEDLTNMGGGNYAVTVTDAQGCTISRSKTVVEPSVIGLSFNITNASLYGTSDGSADLTVTGGVPGYTYQWGTGATTQDITSVLPGLYPVTVTDAVGCTMGGLATIGYSTPSDTVKKGSFIINMGVTPQTVGNGLKPYGMIYDLVKNYKVPVLWSINPAKVKDGKDFTYSGMDYKGGTFIIKEDWITATVASRIAYWQGLGVVGTYTTSDIYVPIFHTFTGFTNVVLDDQNDGIVIPYFTNAGIPSSFYSVGLPPDLDDCSDTYVLPHADPTWADHKYLLDFNTLNNGYIWAGCHAVSVLEGIFDPMDMTKRMNFLSNTGLQCYGKDNCGSLITEFHAGNATPPYSYDPAYSTHPIMQFMGDMTPAQDGGSEQWYIPLTTGRWNLGAAPAITTSDGAAPRKGVKLIFGRGFDEASNGLVMYEGGHSVGGSGTAEVAAQRAFFNFLFLASIDKGLLITHNIPKTFVKNVPQSVSVSVTKGTPPYSYQWTATCGGTFSAPNAATTNFTVSNLYTDDKCYLICEVTDACGRFNFVKVRIGIIQPNGVKSNYNGVNVSCFGASDGSIDVTTSGGTPPYAWQWSTGATTEDISGLTAGNYYLTITDADGYVSRDTFVLIQPAAISLSFSTTNVSCFGGSNGAVDLTPSGGILPYTYVWSTGATTQDISSRPAGTYNVTVTDLNGCVKTGSATITQPAQLTAALSVTNVSTCYGNNDGSIDLTPSGGTSPYTYSWSNGATTQDITNLIAGTYTVTVTDSKGCTVSASGTVTQPPLLTASTTQVNVACNGASTGSIDLTPSGGTTPYSYSWSNGAATQDITSLVAGTYTVTVMDVRGCAITRSATITQPAALTTSETHVNVSCNGGSNGSIDLTVSGGTPAYSYLWSSGQTTQDISGRPAGTYTVTVTDANGCTTARSITITQPPALNTSFTQVNVSCNGGSNGSIDLTVTGGTAPYSYSWTGGITTQDRSVLSAGTYNVTVTDSNGCTITTGTTITQPSALTASATQGNVSCNGGSNGSIDLSPAGGTTPYSYNWSNGATTQDISGLSAGTYTVTIMDANSCTITLSRTITQPAALTASATKVDVSCNGGSNGSIDLTPAGGTTPYSYSWSDGATTQDLSGLSAGTYTVTVTDNRGCTVTSSTTITEPAALTASNTKVDVSCNGGSNGSIDLTVAGGTAPYTYAWSNGAATQDISGLSAGTYTVTITDNKGCIITSSATITQPAALGTSLTQVNVSCNGGSNGSIDLTVVGGTSPYAYAWSTGSTAQDLSGLSAGTYTVTVTDAQGCTITNDATITQPATLTASTTKTDVSCNGGNNGSIDLTVTGGTTPHSYSWSNGFTTQDLSGLSAGTYTVTVTDAQGCTITTGTTITQPAVLAASTTQVNVSCNGGNNGSIDLTVTGGTTPYSYNWSNGATTQDISGLTAGTYDVTVTDNKGCSVTTEVIITQPAVLTASSTKADVSCNGGSNGSIDLTVSGGTTAYSYWWSNGATTQDISGLTAGTYTVTVTDAQGCMVTSSAAITQPSTLTASNTKVNVSCNGGSNGSIDLTVSGGTTPYSYSWSNAATTQDLSGLAAGTYTVTVTDAQGCTITSSAMISQPALLTASNTKVDVSCNGGSNGSVDLSVSGGTAPFSYSWSNGATTQDISGLVIGSYTVTVTDAQGCTTTSSATITQPAVLTASANKVNVLCNGGNNGSVDLTPSGGTTPYSYSWSNGAATQDISTLTAGTYTVTVTDFKGCTATISAAISEPAVISITWTTTNASCNGGTDGAIDLTVTGGVVPFSFSWNTGATTEDLANIAANLYSVTVTDDNACTMSANVAVGEATALSITLNSITHVSCNGGNNGAIDISTSGGTTPYTYAWSNGATSQDISSLTAGSYTVTVTDAALCSKIANYTVTQPTVLAAFTTHGNVSCYGGSDGSIDLTVTGGTTAYLYSWSNGATTQDISGLSMGAYTVTVTDAQGCSTTASATITQPAVLAASTTQVNVRCSGGADGSIDLTVTGGTTPYSYSWSNAATTQDISGLTAATYSVTITDAKNCSVTASAIITEPAPLTASTTHVNVSCHGGNNGSIDLTPAGGTTPYLYSWSNGAATQDISGLSSGIYNVTITDSKGCTVTTGTTITQPAMLAAATAKADVSCNGGSDGSI
ncbi:MAG TPA: SprB repeat-containing protein, partial [Chitinophagales bacterium]|nr:SprB repeat-containing protein [Chitinophagales bacterium]